MHFSNEISLLNLKRNESSVGKPSDSTSLKITNSLLINNSSNNLNFYNKISLLSNIADYNYKNNPNLNDDTLESKIIFSSEGFLNFNRILKPRVKIVGNYDLADDNMILSHLENQLELG